MTVIAPFPAETSAASAFVRQDYPIRDRISADGSSGFRAEPGRYHLYVALGCPWAHRTIIVRKLLGLEDVISLSVVAPIRDERGWAFSDGPGHTADPVNGFQFLSEAYLLTDPNFNLRYSVPALWDRVTHRLVSNNFPDITIDLETQFHAYQRPDAPDLYPAHLRAEIDALNAVIYEDVNNGVYKAGFAAAQEPYEAAVDALFARLDWLEQRLSGQRFLVGDQITEADVRLFPTLVRFDRYRWRTLAGSYAHAATGANLANAERRVWACGVSANQAASRIKLSAVAINRWRSRVLARPM